MIVYLIIEELFLHRFLSNFSALSLCKRKNIFDINMDNFIFILVQRKVLKS